MVFKVMALAILERYSVFLVLSDSNLSMHPMGSKLMSETPVSKQRKLYYQKDSPMRRQGLLVLLRTGLVLLSLGTAYKFAKEVNTGEEGEGLLENFRRMGGLKQSGGMHSFGQ